MDSCNLFNFLFGTKRATTELSKCFASLAEKTKRQTGNADSLNTPPASPLKQLQNRILASLSTPKSKNGSRCGVSTSIHREDISSSSQSPSGTYRANLAKVEQTDNSTKIILVEQPEESDRATSLSIATSNLKETELRQWDSSENPEKYYYPSSTFAGHDYIYHNHSNDDETCAKSPPRKSKTAINRTKLVVLYDDTEDKVLDFASEPEREYDDDKNIHEKSLKEYKSDPEKPISRTLDKKRSDYVRGLVQSIESKVSSKQTDKSTDSPTHDHSWRLRFSRTIDSPNENNDKYNEGSLMQSSKSRGSNFGTFHNTKPTTIVKPLLTPPKTPPKSNKAKFLHFQLNLDKPLEISQLFRDEKFLSHFFEKLEPLDRCSAAQVCRQWRDILYSNQDYWKNLINVIDCTQLRREQLVECILNTLNSAKLMQLKTSIEQQQQNRPNSEQTVENGAHVEQALEKLDDDDIWRIQELCSRAVLRNQANFSDQTTNMSIPNSNNHDPQQSNQVSSSKSSSILSQISSSTLSSASLSSILSPLSESQRIDNLKEKLFNSIDDRGFQAICLFGATDDDIDELVNKIPKNSHQRIRVARLDNCCVTDQGLEKFLETFNQIEELELTGCNEITNSLDLSCLKQLRRFAMTDCINIADALANRLESVFSQLEIFTLQAYHLTDNFLHFLSIDSDTSRLRQLELPNCKELTDQSLLIVAKNFKQLKALSISGSTKISDAGIEVLVKNNRYLRSLDLSWCTRITDISLECIASELGESLTDLILDRNVQITDNGIAYLAAMGQLELLYIRWCHQVTDLGLNAIVSIESLQHLSLAGLQQVSSHGLLQLINCKLIELELTNCPAVNNEFLLFLSSQMPQCKIIY